jgi:hypothetical protein
VVHECDDSTNCQTNREDPLTGRRANSVIIVDKNGYQAREKSQTDSNGIQFDSKTIERFENQRDSSGRKTYQPEGWVVGVDEFSQQDTTGGQDNQTRQVPQKEGHESTKGSSATKSCTDNELSACGSG